MYLDLHIVEATKSPLRRARLVLRIIATHIDRELLARHGKLLERTLVAARFVGRDVLLRDLLDEPQTFVFARTAFAEAVAAKVRESARLIADEIAIAHTCAAARPSKQEAALA